MYKFYIVKTYYLYNKYEVLETFKTSNILKGMKKAITKNQNNINSGIVNDYTSFSVAYLEYNGKYYSVFGGQFGSKIQLQYDESITKIA